MRAQLPPLSTCILEGIVPADEWSVYGRTMHQPLFLISVSYAIDLDDNGRLTVLPTAQPDADDDETAEADADDAARRPPAPS